MNQSKVFLDALFAGKPDELYLLIRTLQGERKRSRQALAGGTHPA